MSDNEGSIITPSLDITLLRILRKRADYERLYKNVPTSVLDDRTRIILEDFGKFFREHDDIQEIEYEPFFLWFKMFAHKLTPESTAIYGQVLKTIEQPVPQSLKDGLMARLVETETANNLVKLAERYNEGEELDLGSNLRDIIEGYETNTNKKVKQPWVNDPIHDLLQDDAQDRGLHWRLPQLNESIRPLRAGDFVIVAARPDVGKTTFLTDNLTYMAPQVDKLFPGEGRSILWFNNEGPGKRIVTRAYQSALMKTITELVELDARGTINEEYIKAVSRPDALRIMDVHDYWNHEIEDVIRQNKPALLVFDMIDNIRFGGNVSNNGQRTDQLLEAMYQWGRVLGVRYDCAVLATSQISADGENLQYPQLSMLKDSKTGKQGAADAIITIGYQSDYPNSRFLGTTKNKLAREGAPKSPRSEVIFDGLRGRFRTISDAGSTDT